MKPSNCLLCGEFDEVGDSVFTLETGADISFNDSRKVCKLLRLPVQDGVTMLVRGLKTWNICKGCQDTVDVVPAKSPNVESNKNVQISKATLPPTSPSDMENFKLNSGETRENPKEGSFRVPDESDFCVAGAAGISGEDMDTIEESRGTVDSDEGLQDITNGVDLESNAKTSMQHSPRASGKKTPLLQGCLKCPSCFYKTYNPSNLTKHRRSHAHAGKLLKCSICDFTTTIRGSLNRHIRDHTGEKRYKCDLCGYAAVVLGDLTKHRRTHTGEKPYKCEFCDYAASVSSSVVKHRRIHTGEKPYKCQFCGYKCTNSSDLTTHQRIHTEKKEKMYECRSCDFVTTRYDSLICHRRTHFQG